MELPFPSKVVEAMIKYMYGTDLDEDLDFDTIKSLLEASEYCGYDDLEQAVLVLLPKHITRENLLEEAVDFKMRKCEAGFQFCKEIYSAQEAGRGGCHLSCGSSGHQADQTVH